MRALRRWAVRGAILAAIAAVLVLPLARLEYAWNWRDVWRALGVVTDADGGLRFDGGDGAVLLRGLMTTLQLSLGAMVVGLFFGAVGCALRISRYDGLSFLGACYVELVRNTPLLVQLYVAYFCIFGEVLSYDDPAVIGSLTLGVFAGAYVTEILRAGIESVDAGQTEAALSLGLAPVQALIYVVAPQAIRRVLPPLAGQFVSLVKDSSLLSIISVAELTFEARKAAQLNYRLFEFYLAIAVLYLAITFPLSRFSVWLERRLAAGRAG